MWSYKSRIDNILIFTSVGNLFYIDKDGDWCFKRTYLKGRKLISFQNEVLEIIFQNIEDFSEELSYKDRIGFEEIKKEFNMIWYGKEI